MLHLNLKATSNLQIFPGANKLFYAPEPLDAGCMLEAEIVSNGRRFIVTTSHPIELG